MITAALQLSADDDEQTDELTRRLREEMLRLEVEDVRLARANHLPAGAKGDLVTVGGIIATLAGSQVLVSLCELVRTWVARRPDRSVEIHIGTSTLKLSRGDRAQQQQLIDAFIDSVGSPDVRR